jgi:hypothetical protein
VGGDRRDRAVVRTAQHALREWQEYLNRHSEGNPPHPNGGRLVPRLKDGGGAFGLGTPIDPEDAEFEKELVEETTRRRAEAFKQRALEGARRTTRVCSSRWPGDGPGHGLVSALGTGITRCFRE